MVLGIGMAMRMRMPRVIGVVMLMLVENDSQQLPKGSGDSAKRFYAWDVILC